MNGLEGTGNSEELTAVSGGTQLSTVYREELARIFSLRSFESHSAEPLSVSVRWRVSRFSGFLDFREFSGLWKSLKYVRVPP